MMGDAKRHVMQEFTFEGIPKAQGRPRFARMGKFVKAYDPKKSRDYKDNISAQIVAQPHIMAMKGIPVELTLSVYLPRPQAHYNTKGLIKDRFTGTPPHVSKPDLDNIEKAIKDACKGILWADDSQVWHVDKRKVYSGDGVPGWFMIVEWEGE
jgi:Holliday junction resolvase RusA-like endonuclease